MTGFVKILFYILLGTITKFDKSTKLKASIYMIQPNVISFIHPHQDIFGK